jgi:nitrilase
MRHVAKEGRCFVVGCCQVVRKDDLPDSLPFKAKYLSDVTGWINPGGSLIVDPDGKIVAGPALEMETILYADVHRDQLVGSRWQLDVAGHYARPDVFELRVHRKSTPMIRNIDTPEAGDPVTDRRRERRRVPASAGAARRGRGRSARSRKG